VWGQDFSLPPGRTRDAGCARFTTIQTVIRRSSLRNRRDLALLHSAGRSRHAQVFNSPASERHPLDFRRQPTVRSKTSVEIESTSALFSARLRLIDR
jgi:hypothetical protein